MVIRPIGPEDARREQAFVRGLSPESRYFRFMNTLRELSPEMLERFTHPDPAREIALVALTAETPPRCPMRAPPGRRCTLRARPVRRAGRVRRRGGRYLSRQGLGSLLMQALMESAHAGGLRRIEGLVLATNQRMLELMSALGFTVHTQPTTRACAA